MPINEYPKHLYRADGKHIEVKNPTDEALRLKEGWNLEAPSKEQLDALKRGESGQDDPAAIAAMKTQFDTAYSKLLKERDSIQNRFDETLKELEATKAERDAAKAELAALKEAQPPQTAAAAVDSAPAGDAGTADAVSSKKNKK